MSLSDTEYCYYILRTSFDMSACYRADHLGSARGADNRRFFEKELTARYDGFLPINSPWLLEWTHCFFSPMMRSENKRKMAHYFKAGFYYASHELGALIKHCAPEEVQAIPVEIIQGAEKSRSGSKIYKYLLMNWLRSRDCIDKDLSEITYSKYGAIDKINKLVVDEDKIKDNKVVMMKAHQKLLVQKDLARRIADLNPIGLTFTAIEDYRYG